MPMDISELKSKKIVELNEIAKELNIPATAIFANRNLSLKFWRLRLPRTD